MFARFRLHSLVHTLLMLCAAGFVLTAQADLKIKSKSTAGGSSSEVTTYIKGKRQRTEHNQMMATIVQCDLRRGIDLGLLTKTYFITPYDQKTEVKAEAQPKDERASREPLRRGGFVTSTITTIDTGERKQMFGYTARHIKTSMVTESSPEACNQTKTKMETDGWYIDFAFDFNCGGNADGGYAQRSQASGCQDQYRTRQVGSAKLGYPVMVTTTMFDESGKQSFSFTQEVVEISKATLDDSLFEIPADFTEVKDRQQLFSAAGVMAATRNAANDDDSSQSSQLNATAKNLLAANNSAGAVGPKKQGVVRIGVVLPRVVAVGEGLDANILSQAVRNTFINSLRGPGLEVIALEARTPQQADTEAKQKECDYLLSSDVAHKKPASIGGFLKKAAPIAEVMTYSGNTS
ncbi:MAG TPA: hypothetical protein VEF04_07875, partial [Blastocatellia bacterium]|nr:hypothetical protein [Blastocatellia bacterium]